MFDLCRSFLTFLNAWISVDRSCQSGGRRDALGMRLLGVLCVLCARRWWRLSAVCNCVIQLIVVDRFCQSGGLKGEICIS